MPVREAYLAGRVALPWGITPQISEDSITTVSSLSDLPDPDGGGARTLPVNSGSWIFAANVSLPDDEFIVESAGASIGALTANTFALEGNVAGGLVRGLQGIRYADLDIRQLNAAGEHFTVTKTALGPPSYIRSATLGNQIEALNSPAAIGSFDIGAFDNFLFTDCSVLCAGGATFSNTVGTPAAQIIFERNLFNPFTAVSPFVFVDFDATALIAAIDFLNNTYAFETDNDVGINVNAAATILGLVRVTANNFGVSGSSPPTIFTPYEGNGTYDITEQNVVSSSNFGLRDSQIAGNESYTGNTTATVLTLNTWSDIEDNNLRTAGTLERVAFLDSDGNASPAQALQYLGPQPATVIKAMYSATIGGLGGNDVFQIRLVKNGVEVPGSIIETESNGFSRALAGLVILIAAPADEFKLQIRNVTDSSNAIVSSEQLNIFV